jgi:hypothetical protein
MMPGAEPRPVIHAEWERVAGGNSHFLGIQGREPEQEPVYGFGRGDIVKYSLIVLLPPPRTLESQRLTSNGTEVDAQLFPRADRRVMLASETNRCGSIST